MEFKKKKIQKKIEIEKLSALEQKEKLEEITLTFAKKAGENDMLFGSVTVLEIEKHLEELGIEIERKRFDLAEPIKRIGNYTCKIKLFDEIEAEIKIEVVREEEDTPEKK